MPPLNPQTISRPRIDHVYRNAFMDSARWDRWVPRDGDIMVCTPYKAGTTWTQMICALLVFQSPDLPQPLGELSPWFELRVYEFEELLTRYAAQTHRRIIKTHTPLDGLPYYDEVTYLYCGRDPRDIFISMQNHKANQDGRRLAELMIQQGETIAPPDALPEDINERFQLWLTKGAFEWERDGYPFWSVFHHVDTFWQHRALPNLHFLHYADLKADLAGQMRNIAKLLGIEVDVAKWPALVNAATFSEMKRNADRVAPDTDLALWRSNAQFFNRGTNGQWRDCLSPASLALYETVKHDRVTPEVARWLEQGAMNAVGISSRT